MIFVAGEVEQGGVDLDGDGDVGDQVTYVFSPQTGKLRCQNKVHWLREAGEAL